MANLQSSRYPLVFPLNTPADFPVPTPEHDGIRILTLARALEGMQKEAIIAPSADGQAWRMACDEGPYLNGTDLAPFPLAFFTIGVVNSYFGELLELARVRGMKLGTLELVQDNFYTMEGSAIRGDMVGGALPVSLLVRIGGNAPAEALHDLVTTAVLRSPADALLRGAFDSEFSITKNGKPVPESDVASWTEPTQAGLADAKFDAVTPAPDGDFERDIITKVGRAESLFGVEGGAGSSLQSEQKRTLHVRGTAGLRASGLTETRVQLFKPIGSRFRFLCELDRLGGGSRAPSPLVYLSAGVAFCYLTQIGRYATIVKQALERYAIAQETLFGFAKGHDASGRPPTARAVRTHVEIATSTDDEAVRRIVDMGERTCFLHAAARTALKTRIRIELDTQSPNAPTFSSEPPQYRAD